MALVLAACGGAGTPGVGEPQPDGGEVTIPPTATPIPRQEVVICAGQRPVSFAELGDPVAAAVWRLVSPQAAVFGEDYTAESELLAAAVTPHRNDDGTLTVMLRYRDDLSWSDGEPFDAADALLGLRLPALAGAGVVLDADAVDDHALEVVLAEGAGYPYLPVQPSLPAHVLGADADPAALADADLLIVALGPYALAADEGAALHFAANPHYPGGAAPISRVTLRFIDDPAAQLSELSTGGCDLLLGDALGPDQLEGLLAYQADGVARVHVTAGPVYEQVIFNTYTADTGRTPFFADARVRQAVAHAVDRGTLAASLWPGIPPDALLMDSWIPAGHWAHPSPGVLADYPLDREAAAALLEAAGWRDQDGDGVREYRGGIGEYACGRGTWEIAQGTPLAPVLTIPAGDDLRAQVAAQIAADLAQVGIQLSVQEEAAEVFFSDNSALVQRTFDVALLAGLAAPDPEGVSRWVGADMFREPQTGEAVHIWQLDERWQRNLLTVEQLAYSNIPGADNRYQGQNFAGWCNETANITTTVASLLTLDVAGKATLYAEQQVAFAAELPVLPLFARPALAASVAELCGVSPGPLDPLTWNAQTWRFDESGVCQ